MDITDIHNTIELYNIPTNDFVRDAILTDNRIYISLQNGSLVVYDRDGQGGVIQSFYDKGLYAWRNNMYLHGQFLYKNKGFGLRVYDVNNNFEEVFLHGELILRPPRLINSPNDLYLVEYDSMHWFENGSDTDKIRIYSLIENRLLKSLEPDFHLDIMGINTIDDYVYVHYITTGNKNGDGSFVGVYQKSETGLHHLNTVFISLRRFTFPFIHDDLIYVRYFDPDRVEVYRVNGQEVDLIHSFNGLIVFPPQIQSPDVIISWNNRNIHFRDINNPSEIIFYATIRQVGRAVFTISDNLFTVHQISWGTESTSWMDIYEFCIYGQYVRLIERHTGIYYPINYGVLYNFSDATGNSTFYSIIDGKLT
jgi:hypothetical protein